ncbi:DUF1275 domain-containing protein [Corynebacterium sp. zg254]|uniref:DUF1275 domain-containing protein n=1 Tax=Corynebacterium zhongnanshanii TaxID=2768834 RepID=A0ABQ6VGH4_9CORY|nr:MULTISPECIES: YoaK family protein [Corynebacterium]KAB3523517.1 DUF1275 domain-containing protein [Corynebacterium zhongnanshanii]MCR5913333.1 DUF1275 domain-containing protein [Corynebacterium sp. zg254]
MINFRLGERILALALTFVAGYVDSVGFIHLGGVFLSFMSGNTTRSATSLVEGNVNQATLAGSCIILFLIGVMTGALITRLSTRTWDVYRGREAVMWSITAVFGITTLLILADMEHIAILSLSVGIGMMNSVFERNGEVSIPLTYMTGTLVKMGQRFVDAFFGGKHLVWILHLALWISLSTGAIVGALMYHHYQLTSVAWIFLVILLCAAANQLVRRHRRQHGLPL